MPSLLTHYEFYKQTVSNPKDIGFLGSQGPDPFFYYGLSISPTKHAKAMRQFGTFLHQVDPYITFKYLLEYIMGSLDSEKSILIEYLKGMFAHYILDKNCHPYIFYISGFPTNEDNNKNKYFLSHTNIESAIDTLIMDHFNDVVPTYKAIECNKKDIKIISKMLFSLGKGCYKNSQITRFSFKITTKHMHKVQKVLYSKTGKKKAFIDKHFSSTPLSSMCEPQLNDIKLDFLNLKHNTWTNCIDNSKPQTLDFYDLFKNAQKEFIAGFKVLEDVLNNKINITQIEPLFNEIDHDGFKIKSVKKYSNYIF